MEYGAPLEGAVPCAGAASEEPAPAPAQRFESALIRCPGSDRLKQIADELGSWTGTRIELATVLTAHVPGLEGLCHDR